MPRLWEHLNSLLSMQQPWPSARHAILLCSMFEIVQMGWVLHTSSSGCSSSATDDFAGCFRESVSCTPSRKQQDRTSAIPETITPARDKRRRVLDHE